MTIAELKMLLENYVDDAQVIFCGGEDWGALRVRDHDRVEQVCFIQDDNNEEDDEDF